MHWQANSLSPFGTRCKLIIIQILPLFDVLAWADPIYEMLTILLIVSGRQIGGWMMFLWYLLKVFICYSPYLLNAPRLPFTYRERIEIARNFAILGITLALTVTQPEIKAGIKA